MTPTESSPERPVAVRTVPVRTGPLLREASYLGTVRSTSRATVIAQTSGTVAELPVEEGAAVSAGQVVARLTSPDADARVQRARAEVRRARAERDYLCDRAAKDDGLESAGAITTAAADLGRKQCATAREAVRASDAQRRELDVFVERAVEEAPLEGTVLEWLVQPGEHVMPGRPLLNIGGTALELTIALTEADLARGVAVGTPATVGLRGGEPLASEVVALAPQARGPGRTVQATLRLPAPLADAAYNGMSLDVALVLERDDDAVAVPPDALLTESDGVALFLVRDDRIERRLVTPGLRAQGWVAVTPAPAADDHVVVGALRGLADGQLIFGVDDSGAQR
jgi:RND family efflux transporter MFP subunit